MTRSNPTIADLWATSHVAPARVYEWPGWWVAFAAFVDDVRLETMEERFRGIPCHRDNATLLREVFADL